MQEALLSNQWYRIANLRPRLRSSVTVQRHSYRGAIWFVIGERSGKTHTRVNASAFYLVSQFDGEKTVDSIWQSALIDLQDDSPSQDEMLQLLALMFDSGLVDFQKESDVDRLFESHGRKQSAEAKSRYWNPLFLRFALFDPDRLAKRILPWCRWAYSKSAFYAWSVLMILGVIAAAYSWPEVSAELNSDLVSPTNLVILWFVFPIMKLLHEFAHACAVKRWGGEVHEFGIAFLVLLPVPYVDASDSASFPNKYRRMAVAGAGIIVESTLACFAFLLWLNVEPGLIRDIAFNIFLTGSVSSLLFNGNPLLKFDSYYVLSDLVEIPSLSERSNRYLQYVIQRYAFGMTVTSPATAAGEPVWFVVYGILANCYRLILAGVICLFVAGQYFFIGIALAVWALLMQLGLPLFRGIKYLLSSPQLSEKRVRANLLTAAFVGSLIAITLYLPMQNATVARGVIWPTDEAVVRAGADCLIEELLIDVGSPVDVGTELLRCEPDLLETEVRRLRAQQLEARANLLATRDRVERGLLQSELEIADDRLAVAEAKLAKTTLTGASQGEFFAPRFSDLVGRYFEQGEVIAYILNPENVAIRTMLDQDRVALLGDRLDEVELVMLREPSTIRDSVIIRKVPAASNTLVTPALGTSGGGDLSIRADGNNNPRLLQPAFEIELQLPTDVEHSLIGEAVHIRFDHGTESLAALLYRQLRLLFLSRFNV